VLGFDGEAVGFDEPLILELPLRPPLLAAPPDVPPLAPDCANTAPLLPAISAATTIARVFRVFVINMLLGFAPKGQRHLWIKVPAGILIRCHTRQPLMAKILTSRVLRRVFPPIKPSSKTTR
jgi:hypothetical protein